MKKSLLKIAATCAGLVAAVVIAIIIALQARDLQPSNSACSGLGEATGTTLRVVILGDSWASSGRLLPGFADGFDEASDYSVAVCSVSYPGRTSSEIVDGYREEYPTGFADLVGQEPDVLVVVVGVNDVIGHAGADNYVAALRQLSEIPAAKVYYVEVPAIAEAEWEAPSWLSWGKNELYRFLYDSGQRHVLQKYRSRAREAGVERISFTDFAQNASNTPLRDDGVHLTSDGDYRFGAYLGGMIGRAQERR